MSSRFEVYKVRHAVRKTLRDWKFQITAQERDLAERRSELEKAREVANSNADAFNNTYLKIMEVNVRNLEQTVGDLKLNYSRFANEQARPSVAYPNGIRFEQFSI